MKKGFTLVELLAVIVILAVISIITIPLIGNVIEESRKKAFEQSINGMVDAIELELLSEKLPTNYTVNNGTISNDENGKIVSTKGGNELNGNIKIKKDGTIIYAINNGKECIIKRDGQEEIEHISIDYCNLDVATNLVVNGYGEYGDNTNFSSFKFSDGAFIEETSSYVSSNQFIKIDTNKKYYVSAEMKSDNVNSKYFTGLIGYDYDKNSISLGNLTSYSNTLIYLTSDLNDGDTIAYVNDLSNWDVLISDPSYTRGILFWNYQDSSGYLYPENTYSKNVWYDLYDYSGIDKENNTITLKTAWNHGKIEAGTSLSRTSGSGGDINCLKYGVSITTEFVKYESIVSQESNYCCSSSIKNFHYGTKYIKFYSYDNASSKSYYRNIIIREIED